MNHTQNITRIKAVHYALEELGNKVVYVGGATVSLYADRPAGEIRPTDDVDILVEIMNYSGYAEIEEKLRAKGFVNDMESGVICRYKIQGIVVDVMPTKDNVFGFANLWYPDGYANAININLGNDCIVKIFQPDYFIASKLEAFNDRGKNDGRMSSDFEDIVFVLNNRNSIWGELKNAAPSLSEYLKIQFKEWLKNAHLEEWVSAHLDYSEQRRVSIIKGGLLDFVK